MSQYHSDVEKHICKVLPLLSCGGIACSAAVTIDENASR
jgi:hypothetical protein